MAAADWDIRLTLHSRHASLLRFPKRAEGGPDQMFMRILCRICHCFAGNSGEGEPSVQPPDDAAGEERTEAAPKARGKAKGRARKPAANK